MSAAGQVQPSPEAAEPIEDDASPPPARFTASQVQPSLEAEEPDGDDVSPRPATFAASQGQPSSEAEEPDGDDVSPLAATSAASQAWPSPDVTAAGLAGTAFSTSRVLLLVAAFSLGLLLFLSIEPTEPWILLVVTALVAVGADGILRDHPVAAYEEDIAWTAPFLFLPTMLALASGLFLEDAISGYWIIPGVFIVAALMGAVLFASQASVDQDSVVYPASRFVLNIGTYLTAFGFYAVVYAFDISLVPAAVTVGLVSLLLSVEVLREAEANPTRALVYAAVVGLIVGEGRWALYFLPVESYLAGVFLLLVFYLTSGLVQHHLNDDLRRPVVIEFAGIALLGAVIVTLGRIFESGTA